ncbi:MAG: hypothetical protein HQL67_06080 [Magnetococcales bacterium]|nr:hypothetical protein [Magnetococcales bacterium]
MAASGMELIKESDAKDSFSPVGFETLLSRSNEKGTADKDHFIRFMPDGSLPVIKKMVEVIEVSAEEIHQRKLEKIEREVYQKAFEEGEKTGLEIGQEKMEQEINRLIPQLESLIRELDDLPHRVFVASEHFLVETLLSFNRALLSHELSVNPEGIAQRVRQILDRSMGRKNIVIRVSPGNAEILKRMKSFDKIDIEGDESIAPGSVMMESDFGGMENNLERRLREVETAFRKQLQERLDDSGISEFADLARERALKESQAELAFLAEDPQPEELLDDSDESMDEDDQDDFPLEAVSEDLLNEFSEEDEDEELKMAFSDDGISDMDSDLLNEFSEEYEETLEPEESVLRAADSDEKDQAFSEELEEPFDHDLES